MDTLYPPGRFYSTSWIHNIHHVVPNGKAKCLFTAPNMEEWNGGIL